MAETTEAGTTDDEETEKGAEAEIETTEGNGSTETTDEAEAAVHPPSKCRTAYPSHNAHVRRKGAKGGENIPTCTHIHTQIHTYTQAAAFAGAVQVAASVNILDACDMC